MSTLAIDSPGRVSHRALSTTARSLSQMLLAGVDIRKALITVAAKCPDARLKHGLDDVALQIKGGEDVTSALRSQGTLFPTLFVELVHVAEQTGSLPEVLQSLAQHYENNVRLKKEFLQQITWPMIQFVAAIGIIGLLIFILGLLPNEVDILGWGLMGPKGAMTWFLGWAILLTAGFAAYKSLTQVPAFRMLIHRILMGLPIIGNALQSFAIARFSWAFYLTQEAGLPIDDSLDASLRATANGVFANASPKMCDDIRSGETLSDTLQHSGLFPAEFLQIVDVAETTGTVPEQLHRLSPQFEDQARRSMKAVTMLLAGLIWFTVAAMIIFMIFTIFMWYFKQIQDAGNML
jgi:type IV pilus assembly protein PilC